MLIHSPLHRPRVPLAGSKINRLGRSQDKPFAANQRNALGPDGKTTEIDPLSDRTAARNGSRNCRCVAPRELNSVDLFRSLLWQQSAGSQKGLNYARSFLDLLPSGAFVESDAFDF